MTPADLEGGEEMELVEGRATVEDVNTFLERIDGISDTTGATVQVFDARYVVDREHVERAVELATRERERGDAIAHDPAVEILLYAAGRRQIDRALTMGVSAGECPVVAVATGVEADAAADLNALVEPTPTLREFDEERVRSFFHISDRELGATAGGIADIVHERVALLVVER
jgi:KEOPS complex subunit Cgi121